MIWAVKCLRPSIQLFPTTKVSVGTINSKNIEFFQWRTPKSRDVIVEPSEIAELKDFISPGDVAIDVGAQIGDSTLPIALACGPTGHVFAFEPNPICFSVLAKNSFLNVQLTRITPIPFACSEADESVVFNYSDRWLANGGDKSLFGMGHGHQFPVPVDGVHPLNFLEEHYAQELQRLRYIKIDVEGLDLMVLRQFEPRIIKNAPFIKFEIAKFTSAKMRAELVKFFEDKPYKFYHVDNEKRRLFGSPIDTSMFSKTESFDVFCVPTTFAGN